MAYPSEKELLDEKIRNSMALAFENTCLASDILLRFPKSAHRRFKEDQEHSSI